MESIKSIIINILPKENYKVKHNFFSDFTSDNFWNKITLCNRIIKNKLNDDPLEYLTYFRHYI